MLVGYEAGELFGASVISPGDLDGDGVPDLVVGAPAADSGAGRVYVVSGADVLSNRFLSMSQALVTIAGEGSGGFGSNLAALGDTDGDGWPDFLVSAPHFDVPDAPIGRVYLFLGGPSLLDVVSAAGSAATIDGSGPSSNLQGMGIAISAAGDANGDGLADFALSSPRSASGADGKGRVYVILGRPAEQWPPHDPVAGGGATVLDLQAYAFESNENESDDIGLRGLPRSLAPAGDVDGDGLDDLWLGSPAFDGLALNSGAVFLLPGRVDQGGEILPITAVARFDLSVAAPDRGLGHPLRSSFDGGQQQLWAGSAGSAGGRVTGYELLPDAPWVDPMNTLGDIVGEIDAGGLNAVHADLDGDGQRAPIAIQAGAGDASGGLLGVFFRSGGGDVDLASADARFEGGAQDAAGDSLLVLNLDGGGYDDVVVGAPGAHLAGAVYVLLGEELSDGDGVTPAEGDCDDGQASVHPSAIEICNDRLDNDCDEATDAEDAACAIVGAGVPIACSSAGARGSSTGLALGLLALFLFGASRRRSRASSIGVLVLLLAGCPAPSFAPGPASISFLRPAAGDRVAGLLLGIEVAIEGRRLAPERVGQEGALGDVLWQLSLDGAVRGVSGSPLFVLDNVETGQHTAVATLVETIDSAPLDPPVSAEVTFELLAGEPSLVILAPLDGGIVPASGFSLGFDVQSFLLDMGAVDGANQQGVGHAEVRVDDLLVASVGAESAQIAGVDSGERALRVELVNNDRTPLSPPVFEEVGITVEETSVQIDAPVNKSTVDGPDVQIEYHVTGFELAPEDIGEAAEPGRGHVHIHLDGAYGDLDGSGSYLLEDVAPGTHTLLLILANNNHEPTAFEAVSVFTVP